MSCTHRCCSVVRHESNADVDNTRCRLLATPLYTRAMPSDPPFRACLVAKLVDVCVSSRISRSQTHEPLAKGGRLKIGALESAFLPLSSPFLTSRVNDYRLFYCATSKLVFDVSQSTIQTNDNLDGHTTHVTSPTHTNHHEAQHLSHCHCSCSRSCSPSRCCSLDHWRS